VLTVEPSTRAIEADWKLLPVIVTVKSPIPSNVVSGESAEISGAVVENAVPLMRVPGENSRPPLPAAVE